MVPKMEWVLYEIQASYNWLSNNSQQVICSCVISDIFIDLHENVYYFYLVHIEEEKLLW